MAGSAQAAQLASAGRWVGWFGAGCWGVGAFRGSFFLFFEFGGGVFLLFWVVCFGLGFFSPLLPTSPPAENGN